MFGIDNMIESGTSILQVMGVMSAKKRAQVAEAVEGLESVYGRSRFISRFDPMEELVSCILSQHSSDASSFPAFTRLREAYPDWSDLAEADPAVVADVIRKAGLANQKAKSIIRCLREIEAQTGEFSLDFLRGKPLKEARSWLMSLPGVGPKTASIVLCFSFGMDAIPVDTHVFRVSSRLGLLPEKTTEAKSHDVLIDLVPPGMAFRFHTSLIQHGRKICRAPTPKCEICPISHLCAYRNKQLKNGKG